MNEKFNFNERIKTENLVREMLCAILNCCYYPQYFTKYHEDAQEYRNEFEEAFVSGLTDDQKKDFNTLDDLNNATQLTCFVYDILYGMKIKSALDELINNPLKMLDLYDSKATNIREMHKSVKQKREEQDDE